MQILLAVFVFQFWCMRSRFRHLRRGKDPSGRQRDFSPMVMRRLVVKLRGAPAVTLASATWRDSENSALILGGPTFEFWQPKKRRTS